MNRLDDIIALNPNHVNILIGGNDIVAQTRILKKDDIYIRFNKINWGTQPTIKAYEAHLIKIIKRLKRETDATISIMSICILGEDLTHPIHQTVDNYNKIVKKIADTEGVIYLPVFEQQKVYLQMNNAKAAIPFEKSDIYIRQAALLHLILRWDWDKITKFNKHLLTFDNLHFNSKGASFIKRLLVKHLSEL